MQETEFVELKKLTSELKEAIISIGAILNKHQRGMLYFGINDNGKVIGQEISNKTLRQISEVIANKIEPKIYPEISELEIEGKKCISVIFEGNDIPYFADGRAYIRVFDQDRKLSVTEIQKMFFKKDKEKWDEKISDKTISDIDKEMLKEYIERANNVKRIPFKYTNEEDVLIKLGVIKNRKLLNAGKVLFCKENNVSLQCAIFSTNTKSNFLDVVKIEGTVFELIKYALDYILRNILWKVTIAEKREEIPEIPIAALREAVINSFAHRDYQEAKGTEVSIFPNRIEIYNPGIFPEEYTPDDYIKNKAHSVLRNPIITNLLYRSQDMETYASGIQRIYEECKKANIRVDFQLEPRGFTIIFHRLTQEKLLNDGLSGGLNDGLNDGLNAMQINIIHLLKYNNRMTQKELMEKLNTTRRTIERNIAVLKSKKILERCGAKKNGYWKVRK